jgi:3-deoxy-7-phosphoheptulonate synthase
MIRLLTAALILCISKAFKTIPSVKLTTHNNGQLSAVTDNKISSFYSGPTSWTPNSWKNFPIKQPPNYPDEAQTEKVVEKLSKCSPLVFAGEVRTLQEELARASLGQGIQLIIFIFIRYTVYKKGK